MPLHTTFHELALGSDKWAAALALGRALSVDEAVTYAMQRVPTLAEHPASTFHACGISFGINSDDPAIFSQELNAEYIAVARETRLTRADLIKAIEDSIDAAFTTPDHKSTLRRQLQAHTQGADFALLP